MSMNRNIEPPAPAGITPGDIYFVVFRHKWKIVILTSLGLVAAAVFYFTRQPLYQSEAEIFIRYVTDSHAFNPSDNNSRVTSLIDLNQNVINSEMAILMSYDLAAKVATNYGPEKILAKLGGGSNPTAAASAVKGHLKVESLKESSVLYVTFRHPDPDLVQPVLSEIITDYQNKHALVHRSIGMTDETLQEKTTQLRLEIRQTEDLLRQAKTNAGIISIADAEKSYQDEMARINRELFQAEASLAEQPTNSASAPALVDANHPGEMSALPLRIKSLRAQLAQIRAEAAKLDEAEGQIRDLERTKKIQEGNFNYFSTVQDQARIDEQLGPERFSNINVIQNPSPPYKDFGRFYKTLGLLAFGGLFLGLLWGCLIELFRSRTFHFSVRIG